MARARPISDIDAQASTGKNARIIARIRLEEMELWGRYAHDPQCSDELHDLRIAAKRLRYTLEIFADVLPEEILSAIAEVTQIQEELGALHDSDVMIALLHLCREQQQHSKSTGERRQKISAKNVHTMAVEAQREAGKHLIANLELVTFLLDPPTTPSQAQYESLKSLLRSTKQQREEQYSVFRDHWDRLQERGFQREMLDVLNA
jgi:hypothetical protein